MVAKSTVDHTLSRLGGVSADLGATLLGEGAYFAPEVGNVWDRWGGNEDPAAARETLKAWMQSQPSGAEGRRQMPQFNLTDQELNDLADFLQWTDSIKTQNWPPNKAG